jgi:hypothetical protein
MQQYQKNFLKSRDLDKDFDGLGLCELLCGEPAVDVHHIESSFRWKRDDNPMHLIWLCREHHETIHSKNNYVTRLLLNVIVKLILYIKKIKRDKE